MTEDKKRTIKIRDRKGVRIAVIVLAILVATYILYCIW